jgi:hypothetical protein
VTRWSTALLSGLVAALLVATPAGAHLTAHASGGPVAESSPNGMADTTATSVTLHVRCSAKVACVMKVNMSLPAVGAKSAWQTVKAGPHKVVSVTFTFARATLKGALAKQSAYAKAHRGKVSRSYGFVAQVSLASPAQRSYTLQGTLAGQKK